MKRIWLCAATGLILAMGVRAGTNGFVAPTFRGANGGAFAGWEIFEKGVGENRGDLSGSTLNAWLTQSEPSAFVTGSGNIYNISGTNVFRVFFASRVAVDRVVFQARTLGAELDYGGLRILFDEGGQRKSLSGERIELDRGTAQGVNVSSKWEWNLAGRSVTAFAIEFAAAGASLSFDSATLDVLEETMRITGRAVDMDRWMYPNNATPGTRPSASVFSVFGEDGAGMDTRWAQFLFGWDGVVPAGRGAANYLALSASITLTINRDRVWEHDGSHDAFETFLSEADARRVQDSDAGRPVELFGAGFRNGFSAATFPESGPFGIEGIRTRNVFAVGFDSTSELIDVSNNVGKEDAAAFEVSPLAVGTAEGLAPGDLAPSGARLTFSIDLTDEKIAGYVQAGLDSGALRFVASSLVNANFSAPNYPQFYTRDNVLATPTDVPQLNLEVQLAQAEPTLRVSPGQKGMLELSWPQSGARYEVLASDNANANATWIVMAGTPQAIGGVAKLEITPAPTMKFFRLRRTL